MRALITGINGFVGQYLKDELKKNGYHVSGMDIVGNGDVHCADLEDYDAVMRVIEEVSPQCVFHLAGQASVGLSWEKPQKTFAINVNGTLNLLESIRRTKIAIPVLIIGSADEYGRVSEEDCPIKEDLMPAPCNPYAISKLAQEQLCKLYVQAHNMRIIMTRSFNHTGPGQKRGFVVPDFCSRIVAMEREGIERIGVGNLEAKRDFSDVRDIVRAYRNLMEKGKSGEIYNVGSGKAYSIRELLDMLIEISGRKIKICVDRDKMRPVDLPLIQSDISKLTAHTGYCPQYEMRQTLGETLEYWRFYKENI